MLPFPRKYGGVHVRKGSHVVQVVSHGKDSGAYIIKIVAQPWHYSLRVGRNEYLYAYKTFDNRVFTGAALYPIQEDALQAALADISGVKSRRLTTDRW